MTSRATTDELLAGLRAGRWRPSAWARFAVSSAQRSVQQARLHPRVLAELTALHAVLVLLAGRQGRRWTAVSWVLAASHLGILEGRPSLGLPNTLTMLRANLPAIWPGPPRWLPAVAVASDLADGRIARRTEAQTAFGAQVDALADAAFWTWFVLHHEVRRIVLLLAAWALLLGIPAAATASASSGTPGTGWIRLAHLSPAMPAMDVYLYSFGNSRARIVLHHVAYGTVSPYKAVAAGDYSVAMRAAGASPATQPVLSASVTIAAGRAYTAAAVGPRPGLRLQVMHDDLATPAGKALVRVIQASVKQRAVTVSWDGKVIASKLPFASLTPYRAVPPGTESVSAGGGEANSRVTFAAGTVHTLVFSTEPPAWKSPTSKTRRAVATRPRVAPRRDSAVPRRMGRARRCRGWW